MYQLVSKMWDRFRRSADRRTADRARAARQARLELTSLEDRSLLAVTPSGALSGVAFLDRNVNGLFDVRDQRLAGLVIRLQGTTKTGEEVNSVAVTNALGRYTFLNLQPGTYKLSSGAGVLGGPAFGSTNVPGGVVFTNSFQADGLTPIGRNLAFARVAPGSFSLRQHLTSSATGVYNLRAPGVGTAAAVKRANSGPTVVTTEASNRTVTENKNAANRVFDLAGFFTDADLSNSVMKIHTRVGGVERDIVVELFDKDAARTVANFYNYATSNRYDDTIFHRLAADFVLQGGGFKFTDGPAANDSALSAVATDPQIKNEFSASRSNLRGTLAMAKLPSGPDTATNQFFFNLSNNAANLDSQNGGFTVFGRVKDPTDQDLLDAIISHPGLTVQDHENAAALPDSLKGIFDSMPLDGYSGSTFPTDTTAANFIRIEDVELLQVPEKLTYEIVSNTNPGLFTSATIVNNRLTLDYKDGKTGTARLVVRATDRFGASVLTTFTTTVNNTAPTATVSLNTASPKPGDTLTATATMADANGDSTTLTYVWTVNNVEVKRTSGVTALTDTLSLAGLVAGDLVKVSVVANDGTISGTAATATATVNRLPVATVSLNTLTPDIDTDLVATATRSDADNDTVTLTYKWYVNGDLKQTTAGTASLTDTFDLNAHAASGNTVRVDITPNDGKQDGATVSKTATVA